MIVENYIESWDSELQHCMVGKLWINYQNLCYIFQIQCLQPHLETLSLGWLFSLQLLCPASALAIASHWLQCTPDTQGSLFSSLMFGLKATLEELSYTVVSNIPSASLLFALYVHVCVSVCANSLQEFRWKKDFSHHPHVPSTKETAWYVLIIGKYLWIT